MHNHLHYLDVIRRLTLNTQSMDVLCDKVDISIPDHLVEKAAVRRLWRVYFLVRYCSAGIYADDYRDPPFHSFLSSSKFRVSCSVGRRGGLGAKDLESRVLFHDL